MVNNIQAEHYAFCKESQEKKGHNARKIRNPKVHHPTIE